MGSRQQTKARIHPSKLCKFCNSTDLVILVDLEKLVDMANLVNLLILMNLVKYRIYISWAVFRRMLRECAFYRIYI